MLIAAAAIPYTPQYTLIAKTRSSLEAINQQLAAERQKFDEIAKLSGQEHAFSFSGEAQNKDRIFLVVIGESQTKDVMSLYTNKFLNSTPFMSRLEREYAPQGPQGSGKDFTFIKLDNAYASYTHTIMALSYALTATDVKDNLNGELTKFDYAHNIFGALKAIGMTSAWISNQNKLGIYDTPVSAMISAADKQYFASGDTILYRPGPDWTALAEPLEQTLTELSAAKPGSVIFVHLTGNHFPYSQRYMPEFARYHYSAKKEIGALLLDQPKRTELFNDYLNSIAYCDFTLEQIFGLVKDNPRVAGIFYFADHGDDPYIFSHDLKDFRPSMARIPAWLLLSKSYLEGNPATAANLIANRRQLFVNDKVFDTILGLTGIDAGSNALTSSAYDGSVENNLYSAGRSVWNDPYFTAGQNALRSIRPLPFAHRCNSRFKAQTALDLGARRIEMDINYDPKLGFCVDHDVSSADRMTLEEVLDEFLPYVDNLWLDMKNFSSSNLSEVKARLDLLSVKYPSLKQKAIIESQDARAAAVMAQEGWFSSYYLDTNVLLGSKDPAYYERVLKELKAYHLPTISYDWRAYEDVQEHIVNKAGRPLNQLSWIMNEQWGDPALQQNTAKYSRMAAACIPLYTIYDI